MTPDAATLARAIAEQFARIENPDDPQLDAYGDLQALIEAGLLAALQNQQENWRTHTDVTDERLRDVSKMSPDWLSEEGRFSLLRLLVRDAVRQQVASVLALTTALAQANEGQATLQTLLKNAYANNREAYDERDAERERCAQIAESLNVPGHSVAEPQIRAIAAAIRAHRTEGGD